MTKLIIIGAGSVGKFIAYNIEDFQDSFSVVGFVDDDPSKQGQTIAGYSVLGSLDLLNEYSGKGYAVVVGIAFPKIKNKIIDRIKDLNFEYPNFISKHAWLSKEVAVGMGSILYPGVSINYETNIGDFVVLNMNCAVGHNVTIDDFSSLAPGVNLGGYTNIGKNTDMGIGAATKQFITIGSDCVVGGKAMVVKNVNDDTTVKGIPAR